MSTSPQSQDNHSTIMVLLLKELSIVQSQLPVKAQMPTTADIILLSSAAYRVLCPSLRL